MNERQVLEGLRVVDLTTGMAGPMATMVLADHGADVLKLEPAEGDWARDLPAFAMWNRQKRSVRVDLRHDRELIADLLATADVVVMDAGLDAPGSGVVDDDAVAPRNPGLVRCVIGGLARTGPRARSPRAYEGIVAAATGRMCGLDQLSGGHPDRTYDEPAFTAAPVAAYGASQLAVQGILAALLKRRRTGRGQRVETSLLDGAMAFLMRQELSRGDTGASRSIAPAMHRGIELCFLTAECSDGRYIQMCARQDAHFKNWLHALDLGDVLTEDRYRDAPMGIPTVADVDELRERIAERMRTRTQSEWMKVFTEEYDVGADPFLTPAEFLEHPDMVANDRIVEIDDPHRGRVRQIGALVWMSETPAAITRPAPVLGGSDDDVRSGRWWISEPLSVPAATTEPDGRPPLDEITILEVAYYIAGPMATTLLTELGARVVKVEPLSGDPYRRTGLQSAKFVQGKESLALDLKHPEGRRVIEELIRRSDVIVHSFRQAAANKLGLDAARVHALNPRTVHLYAASYGSQGPQRDRAAFHSTPNALSGGGIKQAGRGNPPVNDSYADPGSALGAATAILIGLWDREVTGRGQALETTMLTSTGYIHSADAVVIDGSAEHVIADPEQRGLGPNYRLYRCADGWIFVAAVRAIARQALAGLVGVPACGADEQLGAALEQHLAGSRVDDAVALLEGHGIAVTPVAEAPFDEWLERGEMLLEATHSLFGDYWRLPPKLTMSASDPVLGPACAPGEHSVAVLGELGLTPAAIAALIEADVVGDGRAVAP